MYLIIILTPIPDQSVYQSMICAKMIEKQISQPKHTALMAAF
jgi:hypothetical protein